MSQKRIGEQLYQVHIKDEPVKTIKLAWKDKILKKISEWRDFEIWDEVFWPSQFIKIVKFKHDDEILTRLSEETPEIQAEVKKLISERKTKIWLVWLETMIDKVKNPGAFK